MMTIKSQNALFPRLPPRVQAHPARRTRKKAGLLRLLSLVA